MKSLLHHVLAFALLLQGALAVAMPVSAPAPTQASMPCHGGDHHGKKAMACCAHSECACQAICSAIALPIVVSGLAVPVAAIGRPAPKQSNVGGAFRLTPLRPPIDLSV